MENIFQKNLGFNPPCTLSIQINDAKRYVCDGLRYFLGENAKWIPAYEDVCDWLSDNKGKGLLMYGENGLGKTIVGYDILPIIIKEYYRDLKAYTTRANDMRLLFSGDYNLHNYYASNVIFIDDVGTESIVNNYGEKRDVFSDIVDLAEHKKQLLVITTNLTPKEIQERYGLRTLDRLHAITRAVCFQGESLRGK